MQPLNFTQGDNKKTNMLFGIIKKLLNFCSYEWLFMR